MGNVVPMPVPVFSVWYVYKGNRYTEAIPGGFFKVEYAIAGRKPEAQFPTKQQAQAYIEKRNRELEGRRAAVARKALWAAWAVIVVLFCFALYGYAEVTAWLLERL